MAARKACLGGVARPRPGLEDIPGPRPSLPLIGTGWQYFPGGRYRLAELQASQADKFRRWGPVVREEFQWRRPVVHLFRPEDFERVFRAQGPLPTRPVADALARYRRDRPRRYDTPGLANSVGEEWRRLRRALNPVLLRMNQLDDMAADMDALCEDFAEALRAGRDPQTGVVSDLQGYVYRLALEGVYLLSLEARLGCLGAAAGGGAGEEAAALIRSSRLLFEAFQGLFYGPPLWRLLPTPAYRKLGRAESTLYDAASRRIQEVIEARRRSGEGGAADGRRGVLQSLLGSRGLTDKEVRVTVIDFISGGIFTVTSALSFLLHHLSRAPDVQERLHREVRAAAGPDGAPPSVRALARMPLLRACVKESFRLTPTIPTITRILPQDVQLSGYTVPAGVPLFCNFTVPCMQPERFPDPHRFLPDRWLPDASGSHPRPHPWAVQPFGFGTRMCVGRRFAELEMHAALAKLVSRFRMESAGREEVRCKQAFIVVPSHPISIVFRDR